MISVIVPLFNEENNIRALYEGLSKTLEALNRPYEIIFIDDGSTDASPGILAEIKKSKSHIKVVTLRTHQGQAAAYMAALVRAAGKYLITIDADLQYDPDDIRHFLKKADNGFDFIGGYRRHRKDILWRMGISAVANRLIGWLAGLRMRDFGCGFNAFSKKLGLSVKGPVQNAFFLKCAIAGLAGAMCEIPVRHYPRKHGRSKYGFVQIMRTALSVAGLMGYRRITKRPDLVLILILALAAGLRYFGINFGLPNPSCRPDEGIVVSMAVKFCGGNPDPNFFQYPTLYMYLVAILYFAYFVVKVALGMYGSFDDFIAEYIVYPYNLYLMDRMLSAFLGILTVLVLYRITMPLYGKRAARISSFFLAIAYLHVRESHFGVTDVAMTLFIMCSVLFIMRNLEKPELKNYVLAGTFAGLAASTKYAGALLIIPAVLMAILCKPGWRKIARYSSIFALFAVIIFFVTSPFMLAHPGKSSGQFLFQVNRVLNGGLLVLQRGWIYHMRFTLFFGLGWPLLAASLIGIALFVRKKAQEGVIFFSFPLAYYVLIGSGLSVFVRYALPLVPFLCLSAAIPATHVIDNIYIRVRRPYNTFLALLILAVIAGPSLNNVIRLDHILSKKDTRISAAEWIFENIPENSTIAQFNITGEVFLPLCESQLVTRLSPGKESSAAVKYITGCTRKRGMRAYEQILKNEFAAKVDAGALPDYMILADYPLKMYGAPPKKIIDIAQRSYNIKKSFIAIRPGKGNNVFDELDAFYVPFAGFKDIDRPGPNILIYERKGIGKQ